MRYLCNLCEYSTENKKEIDIHHIIPRELGGNNNIENKIHLCPNCHRKIYIPESKKGLHSKKTNNSIQLIQKRFSTIGYLLEYIDEFGNYKFKKLLR